MPTEQKVVGDIYSRPPGGGGGGNGGVVAFPYSVMGHQPLPQQTSPVHAPLQPAATLTYPPQPQQHSVMLGGGSPLGGSAVGSLGGTPGGYAPQGMLGQGVPLGEGPATLTAAKKRKLTDGGGGSGGGMMDIKQEPGMYLCLCLIPFLLSTRKFIATESRVLATRKITSVCQYH